MRQSATCTFSAFVEKVTPVPGAKSAQDPRAESKETRHADPKVEVKKGSGDDAPGNRRGSADKQKRERKSRWDPEVPAKESTKREASKRPDDVDSRPGAAAREASGDDLHSALGRSSAKDAIAPLTASKAMARKPEGSEVRLHSAERVTEGHFRALPDASTVDASLAMSSNRVLTKQVREFIRNGEDGSALEALNQLGKLPYRASTSGYVSRTPSRRSVRTQDTRHSRESRRRRCRPRRDEDRDRRRDDRRDLAMMNRLIETETEGGMIAGGPRGIVTGTVRGADATGGDVMIADRLIHEGCSR